MLRGQTNDFERCAVTKGTIDNSAAIDDSSTDDVLKYDLSIPGQLTERECRAIASVAVSMPDGAVLVEAGSLYGRSSYIWSKNAPQSAQLFCIDPFERAQWIIEWVEVLQKVDRPFSESAFRYYTRDCHNITVMRGYSPAVAHGWDRPIDLYFDDAVHEDPGFSLNVDFWLQFLKPGGVFCGHDFRYNYTDITRRALEIAQAWETTLFVVDNFYWMRKPP